MPAFLAASGSFHVKSSTTNFVTVFLVLDCRLDLFLHFDGIDLPRPFVHRPEILVDALFAQDALVGRSFERAHVWLCLDRRLFYGWISERGSTTQNCQATAYEKANRS